MPEKLKFEKSERGLSSKIFFVFFVVSVLTLIYLNLISDEQLKLVSAQFPDFSESKRRAIAGSYRISISVALFFFDVILVGPFAFLSYFGDHIKPSRHNPLLERVSFFDLGIALALVFTINLASAHILIIDCVSTIRLTGVESWIIVWFNAGIFLLWLIAATMKIYTYSPEQRRELSKYAIKF